MRMHVAIFLQAQCLIDSIGTQCSIPITILCSCIHNTVKDTRDAERCLQPSTLYMCFCVVKLIQIAANTSQRLCMQHLQGAIERIISISTGLQHDLLLKPECEHVLSNGSVGWTVLLKVFRLDCSAREHGRFYFVLLHKTHPARQSCNSS